jgi:glutathione synthase/RimK-type ligase-like ATP-grasp enzyme
MKIAILHHDIEPPELKFKEFFEEKGCLVSFFDIRNVSKKDILSFDLVFNRVYSSVASRDFNSLSKTLSLLKSLEKRGILCINSYSASLADYNKYELYKKLKFHGINTPPTIFIGSKKDIKKNSEKAIKKFNLPLVVKRNCGGKSYEVTKVYSLTELITTLNEMFNLAEEQGYKSGFIIQKFIKSIREHDCRVAVVNGKFLYSYARSFISRNSKDKWMASTSGGSIELDYSAIDEEKEIALMANKAIGGSFSESDVIMTSEGPYIIEVNPTAGYFIDSIDDLERMKIIVQALINRIPEPEMNYQSKNMINLEINNLSTKNECYN